MRKLFLLEMKKLKKVSCIILILGILYQIIFATYVNNNYALSKNIEIWQISNEVFNFLFPLIVSIPFCYESVFEFRNSYLKYINNRVNVKKYIAIKYIATIVTSGTTIFFILFIGLLFSMYIINIKNYTPDNSFNNSFLGFYQQYYPILYGIIICIWRAIISSLICSLCFILIFITNNIFIILTGPFVYYIIENFIFSMISIPQFSLTTAIDPNRLAANHISLNTLIVGPGICCIIILICIIFARRKDLYV